MKRRFSKRRNAVSESEIKAIQELQGLKDSMKKINAIDDQTFFSDSEATAPSSMKGKRKIKSHIVKLIRLYNWNQPIRHIECYTHTVLQYKT